ncbi:hypothetical protein JJB09_22075 [Rhizobium sp. KVB221]|uniref:Transmembrane protein n=1 Tax=Rhizobium setariae TaxID=2801340 RepID=A0A937CMT5_9HYPH|nr:hypothetical protein [Rhizobium setariae]MBL0374705.1 hypothetical protein [Rhizobium setariae]
MQEDGGSPSVARGLYRLNVFLGCVAVVAWFLWETFSTTAAVNRLSAAAEDFPYVERCDPNGNLTDTGQPNCVDLGRYMFINGPVLMALRRACSGSEEPSGMLILEEGKASRRDIVRVEKSLNFQKRNGASVPCQPPNTAP